MKRSRSKLVLPCAPSVSVDKRQTALQRTVWAVSSSLQLSYHLWCIPVLSPVWPTLQPPTLGVGYSLHLGPLPAACASEYAAHRPAPSAQTLSSGGHPSPPGAEKSPSGPCPLLCMPAAKTGGGVFLGEGLVVEHQSQSPELQKAPPCCGHLP